MGTATRSSSKRACSVASTPNGAAKVSEEINSSAAVPLTPEPRQPKRRATGHAKPCEGSGTPCSGQPLPTDGSEAEEDAALSAVLEAAVAMPPNSAGWRLHDALTHLMTVEPMFKR